MATQSSAGFWIWKPNKNWFRILFHHYDLDDYKGYSNYSEFNLKLVKQNPHNVKY